MIVFIIILTIISIININSFSSRIFDLAFLLNFFIFIGMLNHTQKDNLVLDKALLIYSLGAFIPAMSIFLGFGESTMYKDDVVRTVAFGANSNDLAIKLAIAIIVLGSHIIFNPLKITKLRYLVFPLIFILLFALLSTASRTGILALLAAPLIWFFLNTCLLNLLPIYQYYLKKKLKKKLFFSSLDSGNWFEDVKKIQKNIDTKLVFLWTEDHINIRGYTFFNNVVRDMIKYNLDYLEYSWFFGGVKLNSYKKHSYRETKNLIYLNYNSKILKKRIDYYNLRGIEKLFDYIIGYQSIQKRDLFLKLIYKNKFGFFKKNLPFSLEKNKDLNLGYLTK